MGEGERLFVMGVATIENSFPKIRKEGYKITSKSTRDYNCFAWAANETTQWWSPIESNGYYWPDNFPRDLDVGNFTKLFESFCQYEPCSHARHERGFEKVAIYADSQGNVTHAARQTESGKWVSKLGDWEDVEHNTLEALEGSFYGKAVQVLKRAVK
jgi:hypothetical protein